MGSEAEAIAAAKRGERIKTEHSMFDKPTGEPCPHRGWRTIACDGSTDVVECPNCGVQKTAVCNFDEEFD